MPTWRRYVRRTVGAAVALAVVIWLVAYVSYLSLRNAWRSL